MLKAAFAMIDLNTLNVDWKQDALRAEPVVYMDITCEWFVHAYLNLAIIVNMIAIIGVSWADIVIFIWNLVYASMVANLMNKFWMLAVVFHTVFTDNVLWLRPVR